MRLLFRLVGVGRHVSDDFPLEETNYDFQYVEPQKGTASLDANLKLCYKAAGSVPAFDLGKDYYVTIAPA